MAKSPRAALTRIAATVTARYYPSSGASDGFYLDGRISGRREHRAADITLDREERGFFYSIFAHLSGSSPDDAAQARIRKALDKIQAETRQTGRNIDSEINELAECAVSVTGRITLQHDGVRQPYFAGIVIRDSELAAVTMGSGCAYLYRGDVLYPLTADDIPMDAIDGNGKPVQGIDVYCAGVAGTVRYSNIAQLQLDDCIIICNKEVMEALGQREVLRMLFEAEDQADAAGLIITAASAKLPGVPLQFMIGFVESISPVDRTSRVALGRGQIEGNGSASSHAATPAPSGRGMAGRAAAAAAAVSQADSRRQPAVLDDEDDQEDDFSPAAPSRAGSAPAAAGRGSRDDLYDDDDFGDEPDNAGRGRRIAFYVVIAIICIGCLYAIYQMLWNGDKPEPTGTTGFTTIATSEGTSGSQPSETTDITETTGETTAETTIAPTTTANTSGMQQYTVQSGDTLYAITIKYYGSFSQDYVDLIKAANNMTSDSLTVGQVLQIPPKP